MIFMYTCMYITVKWIPWTYAQPGPPRFWLLLKDFNETHVRKLRHPACPGAKEGMLLSYEILWKYSKAEKQQIQQCPVSRSVNQIS